jgi:hypothetical protein
VFTELFVSDGLVKAYKISNIAAAGFEAAGRDAV